MELCLQAAAPLPTLQPQPCLAPCSWGNFTGNLEELRGGWSADPSPKSVSQVISHPYTFLWRSHIQHHPLQLSINPHCWHWESASCCPGSLQQGKIRLPQTAGLSLKMLSVHTLRILRDQNQLLLKKESRRKWKFHCRH